MDERLACAEKENKNRCVLVTGASGGIGGAIGAMFAKAGDNVVLAAHTHPEKAQALCCELTKQGCRCIALRADVTQAQQVEGLFGEIERNFGPVEVLVNNAGISRQKLFCSLAEEEWDEMFAVHAKGAFLCARRALPQMIRQKEGCIVNIASMWGQVGASCESDYASAKAALIGLTKSLAKEQGPSGIRVNCVAPGVIDAGMMAGFSQKDKEDLCEQIPLGRLGSADDVADAVVFLASEKAKYITGQVLAVNGGMIV